MRNERSSTAAVRRDLLRLPFSGSARLVIEYEKSEPEAICLVSGLDVLTRTAARFAGKDSR